MLSKNRTGANPETNRASHTSSRITFLSVFGLSFIAMAGTAQEQSVIIAQSQCNEGISTTTTADAPRNLLTVQLIPLRCHNTINGKTNYTMRNKAHKNYIR
jgi:hypothetical protein